MARKLQLIIIILTLISCQNRKNNGGKSFADDSSSELLVIVNPFETENSNFDYQPNKNSLETHIYVGKIKKTEITENNSFNNKEYYIQLNDKIGELKDLKSFVFCSHCHNGEQRILINADKNTPKDILTEIESEIINGGIKKNQIYYLTFNIRNNNYVYNHGY